MIYFTDFETAFFLQTIVNQHSTEKSNNLSQPSGRLQSKEGPVIFGRQEHVALEIVVNFAMITRYVLIINFSEINY
jgi:hypothetical protein